MALEYKNDVPQIFKGMELNLANCYWCKKETKGFYIVNHKSRDRKVCWECVNTVLLDSYKKVII